jgi:hypothetical protein
VPGRTGSFERVVEARARWPCKHNDRVLVRRDVADREVRPAGTTRERMVGAHREHERHGEKLARLEGSGHVVHRAHRKIDLARLEQRSSGAGIDCAALVAGCESPRRLPARVT